MNILNNFAELQFRLESPSLTLIHSASGSAFSGPGEVWQDLKGKILFKIYLNDKAKDLLEYCRTAFRVGHIRKPDEYFDLNVQGTDRRTWIASQVWPSRRQDLGFDKAIISGQLRELKCTEQYPKTNMNWVEMHFRGLLDYPTNITHEFTESLDGRLVRREFKDGAALVTVKEYEIQFFHSKSHTVARIKSTSEIPSGVSTKIKDAMQFCLASLVDCIALQSVSANECSTDITLRASFNENSFLPGSYLPIDPDPSPPMDHVADFWRLFSNYLAYSFKASPKDVATLSELVYATISARRVSYYSETLALCTAVEGAGKLSVDTLKSNSKEYKDKRNDDASKSNSQIEYAISLINNDASLEKKMKERIVGVLKGWTKENSMHVVDAFLRSLNQPTRLLMSWKTLRHPGAHGSISNSIPIDQQIQQLNDVRFIFYLIIMTLVGYNGPCVNYSIEGWPTYSLETWDLAQD